MPFFARAKCGDYLCVSVTLAVDSFGIMRIFFINTNRHSTKLTLILMGIQMHKTISLIYNTAEFQSHE